MVMFYSIFVLICLAIVIGRGQIAKKKYAPNKSYLEEINNLKSSKTASIVNTILLVVLVYFTFFTDYALGGIVSLYVILECIVLICNLRYLKTKSDNTVTRKYLILEFYGLAFPYISAVLVGLTLIEIG